MLKKSDEEAKEIELAAQSHALTDEQVAKLEDRIRQNPNDIESRASLLGYYYIHQHISPILFERQTEHVTWLIENRPTNPLAGSIYITIRKHPDNMWDEEYTYQKIKETWARQVESNPNDVMVVYYAARFVMLEDTDLAEKYLLRARELDPSNFQFIDDIKYLRMYKSMESAWDFFKNEKD
jgi:hypothetical protein